MSDFLLILPEVILVLTLALVVAAEITYHGEQVRLVFWTSMVGLAGAFLQTIIAYQLGPSQLFSNVVSVDGLSLFFKLLFIMLAALGLGAAFQSQEIALERRTEYCALVLGSTFAMSLVASATNLLLAFMGLQLMNILSYFLAAYSKRSLHSAEAAVKYMAFSVVGGALFLYGSAILFGATHSLNIYDIHRALLANPMSTQTGLIVFLLLLLSLCFQFAAFPMYLWAPDVLEGAPTPSAAFISAGSRAAGFALGTRILVGIFAQPSLVKGQWQILGTFDWTRVLIFISAITMAIGALLAIRQRGAKRLVGSLIVSQTGFLLMGLLVLDEVGVAALLYNLVVDMFSVVGVFSVLSFLHDQVQSDQLSDLKGLMKRAVPESICLVLFLLCLVGMPPLPGFVGKFALIGSALRHDRSLLAMIGIGSMALSAVAVARLFFSLIGDFSGKGSDAAVHLSFGRKLLLLTLIAPMGLVGIFANFVFQWAGQSLGFIFW